MKVTKNDGETVLFAAVAGGHTALVKSLLKSKNIDLDARSKANDDATALIKAAEVADVEIVQALITAGAKGDLRDAEGMSAMDFACMEGSIECVRALAQFPAMITEEKKDGKTPLYWSTKTFGDDALEIMNLLLSKGAAHTPLPGGETPLCSAIEVLNVPLFERLLEAGALPEGRCRDGETPIQMAFANGAPSVIIKLLEKGVGIDFIIGPKHTPPLLFAIELGWLEVADHLIERGAMIERDDARWLASLENAIKEKRDSIVKLLLDAGASPATLLQFAMREGSPAVVNMFLLAGAVPTAEAVDLAVELKKPELVTLLLSYGGPATPTAFANAIKEGDGKMIIALFRAGGTWDNLYEIDPIANAMKTAKKDQSDELSHILYLLRKPDITDEMKRTLVAYKGLAAKTPKDGTTALSGAVRNAVAIEKRVPRPKSA